MELILEKISSVRVYKEGGKPFLHKPLLLLYALGQCYQGRPRLIPFQKINKELCSLFREFYPDGNCYENTHYPFGRLENDEIWEVVDSKSLSRTSVGHLFKSELIEKNVHGGFTQEIYDQLQGNDALIFLAANRLLRAYFKTNEHDRILSAVGLKEHSKNLISELSETDYPFPTSQYCKNHNPDVQGSTLNFLQSYYRSCRYQGVALTIKDLAVTDALANTLRSHFESFECWQQPGQAPAPPLECYVREFCRRAFQCERSGLIIVEPENWLFQWNKANQQAFWSDLSEHYGRFPVIVIARGANETMAFLERYFRAAPFEDDTVRGWISKYQD